LFGFCLLLRKFVWVLFSLFGFCLLLRKFVWVLFTAEKVCLGFVYCWERRRKTALWKPCHKSSKFARLFLRWGVNHDFQRSTWIAKFGGNWAILFFLSRVPQTLVALELDMVKEYITRERWELEDHVFRHWHSIVNIVTRILLWWVSNRCSQLELIYPSTTNSTRSRG
jgi:hypothetical protein